MTPAEMKTIRESLGLSAQWVADQAGVMLRTVQYWEAGRMSVPADVAKMLVEIDQRLENAVAQAVTEMSELSEKNGPPGDIELVRYRTDEDLWSAKPDMRPLPASTHAAMLARTRRAFLALGIPISINFWG